MIAPHYDDELLGCGGLLLQIAGDGAAVRVLFLSDGGAGVPTAERAAYAERRRREAERVAERLRLVGLEHLSLPDGELERRTEEIAAALEQAITSFRPRLLLAPSPLEASADHRATFVAVHRALSGARPGSALASALEDLEVLLYEVNRPLHPDLLVDVTAQLPELEEIFSTYASQEERHPYWRAALGLRRYRTQTLQPTVEAAEGYRRLRAAEFVTRGLHSLVAELGGAIEPRLSDDGPTVSIVVRTRDRPALLAEALASLDASGYRRLEVVLVNDGGEPPRPPDGFSLPLKRVDHPTSRGRAAALNAGIAAAGGDWIAFLDDDDTVERDHFETLVDLARSSGADVVYTDAAVAVYEPDAELGWRAVERRVPYSRDFDPDRLLVDNYIPLHTLLVRRKLLLETGPADESLPFFEDWDLLVRLASRAPFLHLARVTCEYRHFRGSAHHALGERPRERADFLEVKARVLAKHADALSPERLARVVDRLRAEAVLADVERDRQRRELESHVDRTRAELTTLYRAAEEQTAHVGRLYGEIDRLNTLIRTMEGTRAWRTHLWWQRIRGR
ncbi:MAG: PIG-L family deacetylase [Acidobacteria bacterium]|nr:PIG-L family deacetylase [Acidobacteriota bacterium]